MTEKQDEPQDLYAPLALAEYPQAEKLGDSLEFGG